MKPFDERQDDAERGAKYIKIIIGDGCQVNLGDHCTVTFSNASEPRERNARPEPAPAVQQQPMPQALRAEEPPQETIVVEAEEAEEAEACEKCEKCEAWLESEPFFEIPTVVECMKALVIAHVLDEEWQPYAKSRKWVMGCVVDVVSKALGHSPHWNDFARLWCVDAENMRQNYKSSLSRQTWPQVYDRLKTIVDNR